MNENIAIITARGGSKRIPKKNIKEFCQKPIISYSIKAALESGIFDQVMVSTDDYEIKEIAQNYGAVVPFMRSRAASSDTATTAEVLLEVLNDYMKLGKNYKYLCCIYPTAPFVTAEKLVECMNLLKENNADSVIPVVAFSFPPQRCFHVSNGYIKYKWPEHELTRSQDLEELYHDCGQFSCIDVDRFLKSKHIVMEHTMPYYVSQLEVQDIDNETDWNLAELKYQLMIENKSKLSHN